MASNEYASDTETIVTRSNAFNAILFAFSSICCCCCCSGGVSSRNNNEVEVEEDEVSSSSGLSDDFKQRLALRKPSFFDELDSKVLAQLGYGDELLALDFTRAGCWSRELFAFDFNAQ